jgi:excisionase family DNA binding protein
MQPDAAVCRILVPSVSPGLLSVRDVARLLNVSKATVYKLVARGDLPHVRVSSAIRVVREDLGALLSRNGNSRANR